MAKSKSVFTCSECGANYSKWQGKCSQCGAWDSIIEEVQRQDDSKASRSTLGDGKLIPINEVDSGSFKRMETGSSELDRILGGGLVEGSAILLGGDPGIGKSTLLLQCAANIAESSGKPVLYVTAEESAQQVKLRAERLGKVAENLMVLAENNVEAIIKATADADAAMMIIDSIQMVYWPEVSSAPGSVSQVRECASGLVAQAKRGGVPLFLVGHVTKDGAIAGPRVLEHMVDVVLYFEGDKHHSARILRAVKNRFGATGEIGIFEMVSRGLKAVEDPSRLFISEVDGPSFGSIITSSIEGTRPFLVEVQALVTGGYAGNAKRKISGADANRVSMLSAVLEKLCGLTLFDQDIFVNVVGGVELDEPSVDLAIALAIAGSLRERPLKEGMIAIGEIGLGGEVRPVNSLELRLNEAARLGFSSALIPATSKIDKNKFKLELNYVRRLEDALQYLEY
jgi:DNA repair protein RadA/Sms